MNLVMCKIARSGKRIFWDSAVLDNFIVIKYGEEGKKPRTQEIPSCCCEGLSLSEFRDSLALELTNEGYAQVDSSPFEEGALFPEDTLMEDHDGELAGSQDWF